MLELKAMNQDNQLLYEVNHNTTVHNNFELKLNIYFFLFFTAKYANIYKQLQHSQFFMGVGGPNKIFCCVCRFISTLLNVIFCRASWVM